MSQSGANFTEHVEFHQTAQTLYIVGFLGTSRDSKCRILEVNRQNPDALEIRCDHKERTVEECNRELLRVHDASNTADGLQPICKVCSARPLPERAPWLWALNTLHSSAMYSDCIAHSQLHPALRARECVHSSTAVGSRSQSAGCAPSPKVAPG